MATQVTSLRLDEETEGRLRELALAHGLVHPATGEPNRSAAVQQAVRVAWHQMREEQLDAAYAAAAAADAHAPHESADERAALRARRDAREARRAAGEGDGR